MSESTVQVAVSNNADYETEIVQLLAAMSELETTIDHEHARGEAIRVETARIAALTAATQARLDAQLVRLAKARS
jgi:hypothetical protein